MCIQLFICNVLLVLKFYKIKNYLMPTDNTYKYLSLVLGLIAIVFAYLYFSQAEPTVSDVYENVGSNLQTCSDEITKWQTDYANEATSTEKQEALDDILKNCNDGLKKNNELLD